MSTLERICQIVGAQIDIEPDEIQPDKPIMRELGADSLDVMQIVMAVEEEFGIDVPDAELESLISVNDVVRAVDGKLALTAA